MTIFLVFPNSLFKENQFINKNSQVHIIEHPVYFTDFNYHKMKLVLHRSSMKYYHDYIKNKYKCKAKYYDFNYNLNNLFNKFKNKEVLMYDPVDHDVMKDIKKYVKKYKIKLLVKETPLFITGLTDLQKYAKSKYQYLHSDFYKFQRKKHNILMTKQNKPLKGKWSFDVKNRLSFPKNFKNNYKPKVKSNKYINEAKKYVKKHFNDNPGSDNLYIPIDHKGAQDHFKLFIKTRFKCFGPYQDAVHSDIPFGCHAVISPFLNIGLLTPKFVIEYSEKYGKKYKVPIQSTEGFIRQIIGWREIQRLVYMFNMKDMKNKNHFKHRRKLNEDIWYYGEGSTGFSVMDDMITKAIDNAYLHHIERLMYVGNFMLITQTNPKDVFEWFMTMFFDAYNWVMYGNVYAMSQFSTGKLMMTRPYFSSSNYIAKMSNYKKNKNKYPKLKLSGKEYEWFEVWDAIYYNFISYNKKEFSKNYAIAAQVRHWNKKSNSEKKEIKQIASSYMKKY